MPSPSPADATGERQGAAPRVRRGTRAVEAVVPAWFDRLLLIAAWAVLGCGLVVLTLGMFGWYRPVVAIVLSLPVVAAGAWVVLGVVPSGGGRSRAATVGAIAAVAVAVASLLWSSYEPSQHVLVDRDPGSYVTTALWLSRSGSIEDHDPRGALEGVDGLTFESAAVYEDDGGLQFQFNHFTSSVAALVHDVAGERALFRTGALVGALGLLALYSVTAHVTRRPLLSLLVPVTIGACLPFVVLVRDLYSEPFLLLLLWAGAVLAQRWWTLAPAEVRSADDPSPDAPARSSRWWSDPHRTGAVLLGAWFGATVTVRVESFLYLAALAPLLVLACMARRSSGQGDRALAVLGFVGLGAALPVVIGTFDFLFKAGEYRSIIGAQAALSMGLFVVALLVCPLIVALWSRVGPLRSRLVAGRGPISTASGLLVVAALAALWFVRPHLSPQTVSGEIWGVIAEVQRREGEAVDLHRIYSELSVRQLTWYVGVPVVALGVVGLGLLTARLVRGRSSIAGAVILACFGTGGFVYLVAPNIVPDQLWATRRMVPVVLTILVLAAAAAVSWVLDRLDAADRRPIGGAVAAVACVAFLVPTVVATRPLALLAEQRGVVDTVGRLCDTLDPDAVVLAVGAQESGVLGPALRSICGVTVASPEPGVADPAWVADAAAHVADRGGRLVLVSFTDEPLQPYVDAGLGSIRTVDPSTSEREHLRTLTGPPTRYMVGDERFYLPRTIGFSVLDVSAPTG